MSLFKGDNMMETIDLLKQLSIVYWRYENDEVDQDEITRMLYDTVKDDEELKQLHSETLEVVCDKLDHDYNNFYGSDEVALWEECIGKMENILNNRIKEMIKC